MIYSFITEFKPSSVSFKRACRELKVSPSGYFKHLRKEKKHKDSQPYLYEPEVLKAFDFNRGFYGYRKLFHYLRDQKSVSVSLSQVRCILNKNGLRARTQSVFKVSTSETNHKERISERVFKTGETRLSKRNQVWLSDITYLAVKGGGFVYLCVFLDAFSRRIVAWDLSSSLSSQSVLTAFYRALRTRKVSKGLIVHSDRGVQYTAKVFRDKLRELGFIQSMSRKGNCYDNAQCESCFSLLKRELGLKLYSSMKEAKTEVFEWIEAWYNTHRLHSALGYKSPVQFEKELDTQQNTS